MIIHSNTLCTTTKVIKQFIRHVTNAQKVIAHMEKRKHMRNALQQMPSKYLNLKKYKTIDSLYLVDEHIARIICQFILPSLTERKQIVAETAPGLGLVASELLNNGVKNVRLYELCPEFRESLKDFNKLYPNRVELFTTNFFHLGRISAQDKYDRGNRVSQMLKNVPKKAWKEGPCMTVFGCMANRSFINYLLRMMALQAEIVTYGRIQLFVMMRPSDYIKLTAGPETDLHTYGSTSVLFQLLFTHQVLDKYPRNAFLPWESVPKSKWRLRYSETIDNDKMYLVRIHPKRTLPLRHEDILSLYFLVKQLFGRGRKNRVIPLIDLQQIALKRKTQISYLMTKWLPGCGKRLIAPSKKYAHYFNDLSIYTSFGELNPQEILSVFHEVITYEGYEGSAFEAMIQSELVKYETRETDSRFLLEDSLDGIDVEDLEEKFD